MPNNLKELCSRCGCTWGSHHAGRSSWPYNYCPGHEGKMDWEQGSGTVFEGSGVFKDEPKEEEE